MARGSDGMEQSALGVRMILQQKRRAKTAVCEANLRHSRMRFHAAGSCAGEYTWKKDQCNKLRGQTR